MEHGGGIAAGDGLGRFCLLCGRAGLEKVTLGFGEDMI